MRSRLSALLSSIPLLLFLGCGTNSPTMPNSQAAGGTTPTRTYAFVDSLGINTHIFYTGSSFSAYTNTSNVESALNYLGFRYVRDGAADLSISNAAKLAAVANSTGIKYDFGLNVGGNVSVADTLTGIHSLLASAPGSVVAVEGSNEINDIYHSVSWAVTYNGATVDMCTHSYAPVVALQKDLYAAVHADPQLANVAVYNFSVVNLTGVVSNGCTGDFTADLTNIGDTSGSADFENLHSYPYEGTAPSGVYSSAIAASNPVHGKPIVFTETGYSTGILVSAVPYLAVDEFVQARYTLDAVMDLYHLGVARTFLYELLDDTPDTPPTNVEFHYGLFHSDGTPKPAATGFHNLLAILKDSGSTAATFSPSPAALTLTQSITGYAVRDANANSILLQKSDGTYEFVVWGEPAIWNAPTRSDAAPAVVNTVFLNLGKSYSTVNVYDSLSGTTPISQTVNASTVSFGVLDHPIIVEFR